MSSRLDIKGQIPGRAARRISDLGPQRAPKPERRRLNSAGTGSNWNTTRSLVDGTHVLTATATYHLDQNLPPGAAEGVTVDNLPPTDSIGALDPYHDQVWVTMESEGRGSSSNFAGCLGPTVCYTTCTPTILRHLTTGFIAIARTSHGTC